ncbi:MAG: hypothetical protein ACRC7O_07590, partial [Fimbriiglobus sp.]
MKRVIGWSIGAACAAATVAAAGEPDHVDLSNLQNLTVQTTVAPSIAPTVPAPYATGMTAGPGVELGPVAEPAACAPSGCAPSHRGGLKDRLKQWICYKPGPAVVPQWTADPGFPPLMAYFPCTSAGGSGCGRTDAAPGTRIVSPGSSMSAYRGSLRAVPQPLTGVVPPPGHEQTPSVFAAPRTEPDPDAETSPKKDADKDKKPREML